jgi:hypothetical protein
MMPGPPALEPIPKYCALCGSILASANGSVLLSADEYARLPRLQPTHYRQRVLSLLLPQVQAVHGFHFDITAENSDDSDAR